MITYHFSPKKNRIAVCEAEPGECPLVHGSTPKEAAERYARALKQIEVPPPRSKGKRPVETPLSAVMDIDLLNRMVNERYVNVSSHKDDESLKVLCYSKTAPIDGKWNDVTQQARGLIIRSDKDDFSDAVIVERPWRKFFTLQQHQSGWTLGDEDVDNQTAGNDSLADLDFNAPAEVTDKTDGSMGILYYAPDGQLAVSTKGSFHSDQAAYYTRMLRSNPKYLEAAKLLKRKNPNTTFIFELVGSKNQIVVKYEEDDMIFIGAVESDTGKYRSTSDYAHVWSEERGLNSAEMMKASTLTEALALPPRENREGVVIRILSDDPSKQMQIKTKQDDYLQMHRLVSRLSPKSAREAIRDSEGTIHDVIDVSRSGDIKKMSGVGATLSRLSPGNRKPHPLFSVYEKEMREAILPEANRVEREYEYVKSLPDSVFEGDESEIRKNFYLSMKDESRSTVSLRMAFFGARLQGKDVSELTAKSVFKKMSNNVRDFREMPQE